MNTCTAFLGRVLVASGPVGEVAAKAKQQLERGTDESLLIFDDETGRVVEIDFRGTVEDVVRRVSAPVTASAGRPKLGVVGREVTLLPRQWDWLNRQPGGASVALRRLVDEARKRNAGEEQIREAREATYRFLSAMAGNDTGFEEAVRALFAGDADKFARESASWPAGIRDYASRLAAPSFVASQTV
jgi:uncharacterized protein